MVGRVLISNLLTILYSFLILYPGRDAQDNYVLGDQVELSTYFGTFLAFLVGHHTTISVLLLGLRIMTFWTNVFYAATDTCLSYYSAICPITRKHGRWRNRSIFPKIFLLLSAAVLSPSQVLSFTSSRWHKLPFLAVKPLHHGTIFRPKTPYREWIPFFNDTYALSEEQGEFYRGDLLDFVFAKSEASLPTHEIPPSLLAAQGTFMAECWLYEMARGNLPSNSLADQSCKASHSVDPSSLDPSVSEIPDLKERCDSVGSDEDSIATATISTVSDSSCDNDLGDDILSFKSVPSFSLKTPIHELPDEVVQALLELPLEPASLTPTLSPHHNVDLSHFLRAARSKRNDHRASGNNFDSANTFALLIDSGCSVSCSGFKEDFHGQLALGDFGHVNTADGQAKIEGFGILRWDVIDEDGKRRTILVPGYYAPTVKMRLLSPQDYCRYHHMDPIVDHYRGSSDWMSIDVKTSDNADDQTTAVVLAQIDPQARLPFLIAELGHHDVVNSVETRCHCHVTSIYDVRNINLTDAQKRLKLDHDRLGHLSMQLIQKLYQPEDLTSPDFDGHPTSGLPCLLARDSAQLRCQIPLCEACEVARARKRPTGATIKKPNLEVTDGIRAEDLKPGDCVSVDQYESSVRGRRPETKGREKWDYKYCGGTLFYDHASGRIFVHHQTSLSAHETILAKQAFEREAALCGFTVKKYRTDNGVFTSKAYEESLSEHQYTDRAAVGAHHQNGVAEANIGRVQRMARAMLLHLRLHWPDEFSADLWPFALDYAVYIYNHIPTKAKPGMPSPAEVFCGSKIGCRPLRRLRVFGCPTYVLDPRLQDGKKIPKWEPRSRKGQFLGFSKEHASTVGLIRNVRTGYISPQFHVVYDEDFTTVASDNTLDLSEQWIELFLNSREHYLESHDESADGPLPELDIDYRPDDEQSKQGEPLVEDILSQGEDSTQSRSQPSQAVRAPRQVENPEPSRQPQPTPAPQPMPESDPATQVPTPASELSKPREVGWSDVEEAPPRQPVVPVPEPTREELPTSPLRPRRTRRSRSEWSEQPLTYDSPGQQSSVLLQPVRSRTFTHFRSSVCASVIAFATVNWGGIVEDPTYQYFDSLFRSQIDPQTLQVLDVEDAFHPFAFAAKVQSEDFPSYSDILRMTGEERRKWMESMDEEINDLNERQAYELVPRSEVLKAGKKIVKSMWAFRRKRRPDNTISRYKSRLVVRGDLQKKFYDFTPNDTFAPVVEWSTVRMLFSLGIIDDWKTASIDFKSAFTQAQLPEPIYLELPPGYEKANPQLADCVMKITTSLYGDQRAANLWYNKIRKSLEEELGFKCSEYDPCLFIRQDCILCLYVDDAILHARSDKVLAEVLEALKKAGYAYSEDESFSSYLGVLVEHLSDGTKKLSQPGLAKQLLDMMGLADCNPAKTPISGPLFAHADSQPHNGTFNYRSALGILMYLTNNTRPECAYAVNVCAQYSIDPREPHAEAIRRICRYIKGSINEGLYIKPSGNQMSLDCKVDADYAGNWTLTEADDPKSVKSRAGYVITLGNIPVLWKSKRIQEICLSTMESEYISLSMAMRSLVYLRGLLFEIDSVFDLKLGDRISTMSTVFEDNTPALTLATTDPPRMTPRSKSLAVKYHWFRSKLSPTTIVIKHVGTHDNVADIFTKALPFEAFARHRKTLCGW